MNKNTQIAARVEHINLTVRQQQQSANLLCEIFDWQIRWAGLAKDGGHTIHVGSVGDDSSYVALYAPQELDEQPASDHLVAASLNHIGIVVPTLETIKQRLDVLEIDTFNFDDYEPGQRFYFFLEDDIEVEVIDYN